MSIQFFVAGIFEQLGERFNINVGTDGIDDQCYGVMLNSQAVYTQFLTKHAGPYNYLILDDILDDVPMIRLIRREVNAGIEIDAAVNQKDCIFRSSDQPVIKYNRVDPSSLPRTVELQYISFDRDFAVNAQYARNEGARVQQNILSAAVDFILSDAQARDMAYDLLWRIWMQQLSITFEHPNLTLEPGDIVQMQTDQGIYVVQITTSLITKEPLNSSDFGRTNQLNANLLLTRRGATVPAGQVNTASSSPTFRIFGAATVRGVGDAILSGGELIVTINSGASNYEIPAGFTSMQAEAWGGGGSGSGANDASSGGGGSGYSKLLTAVTPGQLIYYSVGVGGAGTNIAGVNGGDSWVNPSANVVPTSTGAIGGGGGGDDVDNSPGQGGVGTIGTTNHTGGAGGDAGDTSGLGARLGGGGGGAAGSISNGFNGTGHLHGAGGNNGGGHGSDGTNGVATAGTAPGGGGGGSWSDVSGAGADGRIVLTLYPSNESFFTITGHSTVSGVGAGVGNGVGTSAGHANVVGWGGNDAFWTSNTKLLMSFDDTDGHQGAPGFDDASPAAHGTATYTSVSFPNTPCISTFRNRFGTGSLDLSSSGGLRFADSSDWDFGSGAFTVECYLYDVPIGTQYALVGQWENSGSDNAWQLYLTTSSQLAWRTSTTGSDVNNDMHTTFGVNISTFNNHLCVDFDGTKYRLYINGVMQASFTTPRTLHNSALNLGIGISSNNDQDQVHGFIDELRITKGVARYASDAGFTLYPIAFPRST